MILSTDRALKHRLQGDQPSLQSRHALALHLEVFWKIDFNNIQKPSHDRAEPFQVSFQIRNIGKTLIQFNRLGSALLFLLGVRQSSSSHPMEAHVEHKCG